jgi:hypothetical protein
MEKSKRVRRCRDLARAFVDGEPAHLPRAQVTVEVVPPNHKLVWYKYHQSKIALLVMGGSGERAPSVLFNWCGYRTNSTRDHINRIIDELNRSFEKNVGYRPFHRVSRVGGKETFNQFDFVLPHYKDRIQSLYGVNDEAQDSTDRRAACTLPSQDAGAPAHRA